MKTFENRSRVFARRGLFWVHASKTTSNREMEETLDWIEGEFGLFLPREYDYGVIIGQASIVRHVFDSDSLRDIWRMKQSAGYLLDATAAKLLENSLPLRGQLGWFNAEVRDQRFKERRFHADVLPI